MGVVRGTQVHMDGRSYGHTGPHGWAWLEAHRSTWMGVVRGTQVHMDGRG